MYESKNIFPTATRKKVGTLLTVWKVKILLSIDSKGILLMWIRIFKTRMTEWQLFGKLKMCLKFSRPNDTRLFGERKENNERKWVWPVRDYPKRVFCHFSRILRSIILEISLSYRPRIRKIITPLERAWKNFLISKLACVN